MAYYHRGKRRLRVKYPRRNPVRRNPGFNLFHILLIGGGGYLLYSYFTSSGLFAPATTALPSGTSTTPGTVAGSTATPTTVSTTPAGGTSSVNQTGTTGSSIPANYYATLKAAMLQLVGGSATTLLTPIEWAYYHSKYANVSTSPSAATLGLDPAKPISIDTYLAAYTAKGLTGLGMIASMNPFRSGYGTMGLGACYDCNHSNCNCYGVGEVSVSSVMYPTFSNPDINARENRTVGPRGSSYGGGSGSARSYELANKWVI